MRIGRRSQRRREFLIDSGEQRRPSKRFRNRFLNMLCRLIVVRKIMRLFRISWLLNLALLGMLIFIIFALFSPYFDLKSISVVRDNPNIDAEKIEQVLKPLYGRNILFLSKQDIIKPLRDAFPEFRDITIREDWPEEIELQVTISPPFATILNNATAEFSVISEDGVVLQNAPEPGLPIIKLYQYEDPIQLRSRLAEAGELQKIIEAKKLIEEELDLPILEIHYYWAAREVHIISRGEMQIWVDLSIDIPEQVQKLLWAEDNIGLYTRSFHHIDLRIPKRIFWEWKE